VRARLEVVRMLLAGLSVQRVAILTRRGESTVRAIERRFRAEGVDGLRDKRTRSRPLDAEQRAILAARIREARKRGHAMGASDVQRFVRERWDRKITAHRARALLA
jgi:transposase